MILVIVLGLILLFIVKTIFSTVYKNRKRTQDLSKEDRNTLLWRYGPFKIDQHTINQFRKTNVVVIEDEQETV